MSGNELPYAPIPAVTEAITRAIPTLHRYPDTTCRELVTALARRYDVDDSQVAVGNGSSAILRQLFALSCTPDHSVMFGWPAFGAYPLLTAAAGAAQQRVPLTSSWELDLDGMLESITPRTRVVVVSTPHNPTGTTNAPNAIRRFLADIPPGVLVVLDEAYQGFIDPGTDDGIMLALQQLDRGLDNVAVVRTFSKAFGLAGLRVGYVVTSSARASALRAAALPFEVNTLAQVAALAALDNAHQAQERSYTIAFERNRMREALVTDGFEVPPSAANFLWLPLGNRALALEQHCLSYGLTTLAYPGVGLRVTVGAADENDAFISAARAWRPR